MANQASRYPVVRGSHGPACGAAAGNCNSQEQSREEAYTDPRQSFFRVKKPTPVIKTQLNRLLNFQNDNNRKMEKNNIE